ncbi:polygalacturonase-like [Coffea eugenioides]|uniref:Polygalacturonase-like n=1 Tax=Coffea arabica TaxID=13443 RepID=A0A6P6UBW8_COFAR|nr:polygalacturonase-like [Coffea arabica]XP_027183729.1 polygalacturonase-like [Coffea eugenioides]
MAGAFGITLLCSWLFFTCIVQAQTGPIDVTQLGAKPDGSADMSQVLADAWKQACNSTTASTILIPKGTFLLKEANLEGPCKAPVEIQIQGTIKAPEDPAQISKDKEWMTIIYVDQLTLSGGGTLDGQGAKAWTQNECRVKTECSKLPNTLSLNFVNNTVIRDLTSLNSKLFHVNLFGCNNITFQHFTITAPGDSPNTDGIHIGHSTGVVITDSNIGTGDDCISIGDGAKQVNISKVTCGPGHGISVGSLGRYDNELPVEGIFVTDCTISGTLNGVRVKSWPASKSGSATNMHFEGIIMQNVSNPVIIDQEYCPNNQCTNTAPSSVKIAQVSFKNITGTSATPAVVTLLCSKSIPCEGVEVADIDLAYNGNQGNVSSNCANVKPALSGKLNPPICANATVPAQAA